MNELTITIQKQMHQKDEQIKKHMEEYASLKNKISSMTKKDTGSLQVRDFTDEIYKDNRVSPDIFVESKNSELFTNLMIVIHQDKFNAFQDNMPTFMENYYSVMDAA